MKYMNDDIPQPITDLKALRVRKHRRRPNWDPFMRKYNCQVICEVGVQEGANLGLMIEHNPKEAYAIDPWKIDGILSRNASLYEQQELDNQYSNILALSKKKKFLTVIRDYSFNAVKNFPDEYFDFVYIDADHTYGAVKKDIEDWYPKVKKGGFLIGDDYRERSRPDIKMEFGVIKAVNEFSKKMNLNVYEFAVYQWVIIKK